ncbi:MAG TPA: zinc ribbon domain-containing protein [Candidatus Limnocylindrales bacterium]
MPLYDYDCAACGRRFEVIHGVHADGPAACPLCGEGPVKKAFAAPAIHFKGSGWAKKERRAAARSRASTSTDDASGGDKTAAPAADAASGESKPADPAPSTGAGGGVSTD